MVRSKLRRAWNERHNRSVATISRNKLNVLLAEWPPGAPRTSPDLAGQGISADLAVHYARAGWLERLERGTYRRPGDPIALHPSLRLLEQRHPGLHVGGTSALDWRGVRHFVSQNPTLRLYGWTSARLPDWFVATFPSDYHRLRLFDEKPESPLRVAPFEQRPDAAAVSEPERAVLEVLSEVGVRQTLEGARELMGGMTSLRAAVLMELLRRCTSVKTVRLCLMLGGELDLPWAKKLDRTQLPTGSRRDWVYRGGDGLLILPPP